MAHAAVCGSGLGSISIGLADPMVDRVGIARYSSIRGCACQER